MYLNEVLLQYELQNKLSGTAPEISWNTQKEIFTPKSHC